jgi:predicted acylesterase/phospholipase RssA
MDLTRGVSEPTELLNRLRDEERLGVVFTGGSARCAFQVGVAECLTELGIRPAMIAGVSGGAWNAAAYATDNVRRLRHYWRFFNRAPHVDFRNIFREQTPFLYSRVHLRAFERYVGRDRLTAPGSIPFHVGITRLRDRRPVLVSVRDVADPFRLMLASNYLPPFYTHPIEIGGELYGDGGLSDNLPYERLLELGANMVLIVSVNGESAGGMFRNPMDVDHQIPSTLADRVATIRPRHKVSVQFVDRRWERLEETMNLGYLRARELLLGERHPATHIRGRTLEPIRTTLRLALRLRAAARDLRRRGRG